MAKFWGNIQTRIFVPTISPLTAQGSFMVNMPKQKCFPESRLHEDVALEVELMFTSFIWIKMKRNLKKAKNKGKIERNCLQNDTTICIAYFYMKFLFDAHSMWQIIIIL